jgi:hypothetical protein
VTPLLEVRIDLINVAKRLTVGVLQSQKVAMDYNLTNVACQVCDVAGIRHCTFDNLPKI